MRNRATRWILPAAVAVHLVAAWFSTGFHSADEHYQVIPFAETKLGDPAPDGLPWEYAARIRPAFMPTVCAAVFSLANTVGLNGPFTKTFLLRLLTALFALLAVTYFVRSVRQSMKPEFHKAFLLLSYFLWFLPFLHVRFTGETWSGLFLILALAPLLSGEKGSRRYWRCGSFLGLAFLCRPPTLAATAGIVLWLVVVKRGQLRDLLQLIAAFVIVLLAGVALDSWFYGEFTLTAWNYLRLGITGSTGHHFTQFPWWYYYAWVFKYAIPLFGALILLAFGSLCAFKPRHLLTWVIVPFLLLHMLLPHKELRFLYPLADLLPLLLILAAQTCMEHWPSVCAQFRRSRYLVAGFILLIAVNLPALAVVVTSPAGSGSVHLAQRIRKLQPLGQAHINYLAGQDAVWHIRIPAFYLAGNQTDTVVKTPCFPIAKGRGRVELLVAHGPTPVCPIGAVPHWTELAQALPPLKQWALKAYEWEDAKPVWKLYRAVPSPTAHEN